MAAVTNELLCENLKAIQNRLGGVDDGLREVRSEIVALRHHTIAVQQDVANLYSRIGGVEARLDRIGRRLDIIDTPVGT